ncbi:MAG: hypothetical protein IK990_17470 [Ruminiclostridium sp.]|nr:hypothetical protein [Ruminiclostridium sp.]
MDNGIIAYKCPACGASIPYSAQSGDFCCEYCGSHFTQEQLDAPMEGSTEQKLPGQDSDGESPEMRDQRRRFGDENRLYMCPSCGASVITDSELDASAECYYCHSPVVLSGRLSGEYRPDLIIPFSLDRDYAIMQFSKWIAKRKFFLAKGFGSEESMRRIQGIYIPFWLVDCCVEGKITADCYKNISSVRKGDYTYVTESKHKVVREGSLVFRHVPADASSRADDALMDSIEPFDYKDLRDFDMSYLSGHSAQRYDVPREQVFHRVDSRVTEASEEVFRKSIRGYSRTEITGKQFGITNINYKQAMLPMWFLTFFYKDKLYYFAMNGQTGKFGGLLPLNKLKLALVSFGIPTGVLLLMQVFLMLFGGL